MRKNTSYFKINEQITYPRVRIVGEGIESKVVTIKEALSIAEKMELDLIDITNNNGLPLVKVADYEKFLYEKKKKEKELEKNNRKSAIKTKEIRFTYNTDTHDFNFKLKNAKEFLKDGMQVKATVFFSGREITFKDQGQILLLKFVKELEDVGKITFMPKLEGKRMYIVINPKKNV